MTVDRSLDIANLRERRSSAASSSVSSAAKELSVGEIATSMARTAGRIAFRLSATT